MAETTQTGSSGSSGSGAAQKDEAPRYSREELPEYLGKPPAHVMGALDSSRKQTFTVAEAEKALEKFYGHVDESEMAQQDEPEAEE